jgi:hypothetical protein
MRQITGIATLAVVAVLTFGCSSSSGGSGGNGSGSTFAAQLCMKEMACGTTPPTNCTAVFSAVVLSSSCQSQILNASCADLTAATVPASLSACLPACSNMTDTCSSDGTITTCTGSYQLVLSCSGVCSANSKTYSGTCGSSYMGQMSTNGSDQCWCQ